MNELKKMTHLIIIGYLVDSKLTLIAPALPCAKLL